MGGVGVEAKSRRLPGFHKYLNLVLARSRQLEALPTYLHFVNLFFIPKGLSSERALGCYDPLAGVVLMSYWRGGSFR